MVDEADLLAAMEAAGGEPPACTCEDKCAVGAIRTDCPVCSVNMGECAGVTPEPEPEPTTEPEPEKKSGLGSLFLVLAIFAVGGGAGWYFKIYRPKQQAAAPGEDFDEAEEYGEDYGGGEYDDLPPWDEDGEETEGGE